MDPRAEEAQAAFERGDYQSAVDILRDLVASSRLPEQVAYRRALGQALERVGRYSEAADCFRRTHAESGSADDKRRLERCLASAAEASPPVCPDCGAALPTPEAQCPACAHRRRMATKARVASALSEAGGASLASTGEPVSDAPLAFPRHPLAAGLMAIFAGITGMHRFYCGSWKLGLANLISCLVALAFPAISMISIAAGTAAAYDNMFDEISAPRDGDWSFDDDVQEPGRDARATRAGKKVTALVAITMLLQILTGLVAAFWCVMGIVQGLIFFTDPEKYNRTYNNSAPNPWRW